MFHVAAELFHLAAVILDLPFVIFQNAFLIATDGIMIKMADRLVCLTPGLFNNIPVILVELFDLIALFSQDLFGFCGSRPALIFEGFADHGDIAEIDKSGSQDNNKKDDVFLHKCIIFWNPAQCNAFVGL